MKKILSKLCKGNFSNHISRRSLTFVTMFERMLNHNYKKEKVVTSNFNERNGLLAVGANK
jgi:hypothetical protein